MIALTAKWMCTPLERVEHPVALLDGAHIARVGSKSELAIPSGSRVVDFGDATLAPGFIDIHVHGGAGHDVMQDNPAGLADFEQLQAKHGVTSYFPTTVTAPLEATLAALDRLASEIESANTRPAGRTRPLGIHLEGPFLSHARRGVHPPDNLLSPTISIFDRLWQAARGQIRIMTIAPELPGAQEVITEATHRGVCVSLGHSDADLTATETAIAAGARHATHTFNAMRPLNHRDPGIIGAVLTDSRLTADIIADGIHLDPAIVKLFLKAKGTDGAVLITDATAATGMPDGRYRLGEFDVDVKNGKCTADGKLAGSVLTMDRAVQNVIKMAGLDMHDAVRLASLNPASVTRLSNQGQIAPGCRADIVVLNSTGNIIQTIIGGAC